MLTPPWNPSIRFPALTGGASMDRVTMLLVLTLDSALRKGYGRTWEGMARSLRSVSGSPD